MTQGTSRHHLSQYPIRFERKQNHQPRMIGQQQHHIQHIHLHHNNMILSLTTYVMILLFVSIPYKKHYTHTYAFHLPKNGLYGNSYYSQQQQQQQYQSTKRHNTQQQQIQQHLSCMNHNHNHDMNDNTCISNNNNNNNNNIRTTTSRISKLQRKLHNFWNRFDTIQQSLSIVQQQEQQSSSLSSNRIPTTTAQNTIVLTSGIGNTNTNKKSIFGMIRKIHDPIFYFIFGILFGFKYDWCFKSPIYWFVIGFTIKWYRARYVFKIPVWDRQPNWNNIITSKEQEKDLKAYTCKNCGSTIFIAKTREFFFEGNTGFGGLGCFTCGAKGKDNFIMDRERIVEDVGDMDDYFEYERPLDFISRAERRKLLKETKGDEELANQLLLERTTGISSSTSSSTSNSDSDTSTSSTIDAEIVNVDNNIDEDKSSNIVTDDDSIETELNEIPQMINEEIITTNTDNNDDDVTIEEHSEEIVTPHVSIDQPSSQSDNATEKTHDEVEESKPVSIISTTSLSSTTSRPKQTATVETKLKPKSTTSTGSSLGLDGLDELDMDAW